MRTRRAPPAWRSILKRSLPPSTLLCLAAALAAGCERTTATGGMEGPAPTAEERLAAWAELPEGTSVPVALGFTGPLTDSVVIALLERHELRPYTVYMTAAGMGTAQRRDRSRASLELLAEGREQAIAQLRASLCAQRGRARAMLAEGARTPESDSLHRAILSRFLRIQRALPALELGGALVYGVEAVGELEDVRAIASEPGVVAFEPGWRGQIEGTDTVVVPQPPAPGDVSAEVDPEIAALDAAEIAARMTQLAENGMGSCADASAP